ncbi:MAG: DUF4313 domain-containing protein [Gemmataceae bacterium]|nr:DUF4313 domain-containing protein [Gemmataceae bacterium]
MKVQFSDFECEVRLETYQSNGRPALLLVDAKDGEEVAVATVNVPEVPLAKNEVLIKDYSENRGMLKALQSAGVVEPTGRVAESGFARLPVCKLSDAFVSFAAGRGDVGPLAPAKAGSQSPAPPPDKGRSR